MGAAPIHAEKAPPVAVFSREPRRLAPHICSWRWPGSYAVELAAQSRHTRPHRVEGWRPSLGGGFGIIDTSPTCRDCRTNPPRLNRVLCQECADLADLARRGRARKLTGTGLCIVCAKRHPDGKFQKCRECLDTANEARKLKRMVSPHDKWKCVECGAQVLGARDRDEPRVCAYCRLIQIGMVAARYSRETTT